MSCRKRDPTLTIRNISQALEEVTDYHGLGIQLGLPPHELNKIEANHQRVERRKTEVLALWLQGPDPKWKDLIVALQLINLTSTARKIQEAIQRGDYQADSWLKPESLRWRMNYCCQRLLERGTGALLLLVAAMLFAVITILLYSVKPSPAIPVKPESEGSEMNVTEDSIEPFEIPRYAPDNLPFLDPTLPFVGREGDVRNVTNLIVLNRVSIVGISGPPTFGKSTLAIHIGHEVVENHIMVGYINADEDDLFSEVPEGIGTRELLTMEGLRLYFGRKQETASGENAQSAPKRWEEVKRWAAELKFRALLILDNCDAALEEQGGELFKKVVRDIWKAGRGRLQLIITSQKGVAFANINFLPYPIRKLSLQASVNLLKKMVEGFDVELSAEQANTIGNLSDGCPLALRIIGTELRRSEMGTSEMIHALEMEILKVISDHRYPNVSRFEAIMNVAYSRLSAGEQFCAQQVSFFPASFDSQAGVRILEGSVSNGDLCISVLFYRSLLDRYWIRYEVHLEKRFVLYKLIRKFFMLKYIEANANSTFLSSWNSFNNTFRNFYSDYVSSYIASEKTEWQEQKFRAEAHNTQTAMAITITEQSSVTSPLELTVVYGYYRRMVPMNSMTFQRVYYMFNDQEHMCDVLTMEVCSAILADLLYQYYIYECKEERHNCTLFMCEHVIHASNIFSKVWTIPVDNPSVRSFLSLFHRYNYMCNFLFGNHAQPFIFGILVVIHLLLFIVRRSIQQVMHASFCILFSVCLALSSFVHYSIPCGLGILEAFSIVYGHSSSTLILLRLEYIHLCLLLFTLPPLPYLTGYILFVTLLIYIQGLVAHSWSGSQAIHSQGPNHVILCSNSEHRILLLCIYAVAVVSSVNSSISQNHIIDFVVMTCLVLLVLCITTVNVFPPLCIFGIKVQHLYSFIHVCLVLTPEVFFHFLWQSSLPIDLFSPIPWSLNVVAFENDLCYVPLSVVALGLLIVMLFSCSLHIIPLAIKSRHASLCSGDLLNV